MGGKRISDSEIETARKLAQRARGVTKAQLADKLKVEGWRAAEILRRVPKIKCKRTPKEKATRTLVYSL